MHSIRTQAFIGTKKPVYRDSPAGKLEEVRVGTMQPPLQQGFDSDSQASFPVTIYHLSAFTPEQGIVAYRMPFFSHSTAAATPLTGVVGINDFETDSLIKAPIFEVFPEQGKRHTKNLLVEPFTLATEPFELLNTNVSIVFDGEIGDVPDNSTYPVFDKVPFAMLELVEFPLCGMIAFSSEALKQSLTLHNFPAPPPDVFPEVKLLENLAFGGKDAHREAFAVHINANHVGFASHSLFLGQESNNFAIRSQPVGLANPPISNQIGVSLEIPVLLDCHGNPISGIQAKLNKKVALGTESLAVSRSVELDSDGFQNFTFAPDHISYNVADNLAVERGVCFAN